MTLILRLVNPPSHKRDYRDHAPSDVRVVCERCEGLGWCLCDACGDEHDCGYCDGEGYTWEPSVKTPGAETWEQYLEAERMERMLEKRYGHPRPKSIANWWRGTKENSA